MLEFYKTVGGRRFIDGTMPKIADSLKVISDHLREQKTKRLCHKEEVVSILENLIDGRPDDGVGIPLSTVLRYVEQT